MNDKDDDSLEAKCNALAAAIYASGVSTVDFLRAWGHDVIETPDGEICNIVDAPAIELPDGRKYRTNGTPY